MGKRHFLSLRELLLVALRGDCLDDVNLVDIAMVTMMVIVMTLTMMYLSTSALSTSWTANHILSLVALSLELT